MQLKQCLISTFVLLFSLNNFAQNDKRVNPIDESSYQKYINPNWVQNAIWDDGLAEVAVYEANKRIYNINRSYECVYVSMFFKKDEPMKLHKMTISSQEWCGNTYKVYTPFGGGYRINYNSYWDGEGSGEKIQEGDFLFEDQLPFTLRMMDLQEGLSFNARLMQTQISAKVGPIYADLARFRVRSTTYSFNENEIEAWKVVAQLDLERANIYTIEKAYPNRLLSVKTWDQRSLALKEVKRYAYWEN